LLLLLLFPTHLLSAVENAVKRIISCINSLFSFHVPAFDQSIINCIRSIIHSFFKPEESKLLQ